MKKISDDQLLDVAQQLIAIESTADNTPELYRAYDCMVNFVAARNKNITIEHFIRDGHKSFLAYRGPKRPDTFKIILNGHLDVVQGKPEQFRPYIKDGKLYGRGAYDMKAAAIVLADTFCDFVDTVPYNLGLQIVTDEEGSGNRGTEYQVAEGVRGDFVICGECGRSPGDHEIANESKGIVISDIEFKGTSAHGAYLWRGENAILRATAFAHKLLEHYPVPSEEAHHTTVNISSIRTTNTALTKVPDNAAVTLDIRFVSDDPHFKNQQTFEALVKQIDPSATITKTLFNLPYYAAPDGPIMLQLKAAAEEVEKHPFTFVRRHGTSDARYYGMVGNEACEFGIAGVHSHADNEHITLKAFKNYRQTMRNFIEKTATA